MERSGDVFGTGFAIEGIFFFTEAIFIAIYIYGWKRLDGWTHFWTGVPIVIAGIGGAFSVVAVNSWMNQPAGLQARRGRQVTDVEPLKALFNHGDGLRVPAHARSPPTWSSASGSPRSTRSGCSAAVATGTTGSAS